MVPIFWTWVRKNRRYGRHVREYVMNIWEMCQCHGACFGCGKEFRGYGRQLRENLVEIGKCANVMVPSFLTWVRKIRRYGRQVKEYVVDMREMCQCYGACVLDVGENSVGTGIN